jgi:hypothetical protein
MVGQAEAMDVPGRPPAPPGTSDEPAVAPGARPHLPVDRRAPLEEFERIAGQIPVFRVTADRPDPRDAGG